MASAGLRHGGAGSSRASNGFKVSSISVDWLGREMNEMRLRFKVDLDDDRDSEHDIIYGVGTETGHVIRTTLGGRNGQSKQLVSYIAEHIVGTGSFEVVFQANVVRLQKSLLSKRFFMISARKIGNCRLCKCWTIPILSLLNIHSSEQLIRKSCTSILFWNMFLRL